MCANRGDGARALNLARDQRTSNCGPPQEKFMVCYTVFMFTVVLLWCMAEWDGEERRVEEKRGEERREEEGIGWRMG